MFSQILSTLLSFKHPQIHIWHNLINMALRHWKITLILVFQVNKGILCFWSRNGLIPGIIFSEEHNLQGRGAQITKNSGIGEERRNTTHLWEEEVWKPCLKSNHCRLQKSHKLAVNLRRKSKNLDAQILDFISKTNLMQLLINLEIIKAFQQASLPPSPKKHS